MTLDTGGSSRSQGAVTFSARVPTSVPQTSIAIRQSWLFNSIACVRLDAAASLCRDPSGHWRWNR